MNKRKLDLSALEAVVDLVLEGTHHDDANQIIIHKRLGV
jgi:hypothetical protein